MKLLNAFTPAMLPAFPFTVSFYEVTLEQAKVLIAKCGLESCVGHAAATEMYSAKLGVPVPLNRCQTQLASGEFALLGQYMGPRLPEGKVLTAEEQAQAPMKWLVVLVSRNGIETIVGTQMDHGVYFSMPKELTALLYATSNFS
jgi:hypothetical protein